MVSKIKEFERSWFIIALCWFPTIYFGVGLFRTIVEMTLAPVEELSSANFIVIIEFLDHVLRVCIGMTMGWAFSLCIVMWKYKLNNTNKQTLFRLLTTIVVVFAICMGLFLNRLPITHPALAMVALGHALIVICPCLAIHTDCDEFEVRDMQLRASKLVFKQVNFLPLK